MTWRGLRSSGLSFVVGGQPSLAAARSGTVFRLKGYGRAERSVVAPSGCHSERSERQRARVPTSAGRRRNRRCPDRGTRQAVEDCKDRLVTEPRPLRTPQQRPLKTLRVRSNGIVLTTKTRKNFSACSAVVFAAQSAVVVAVSAVQ